MQQELARKNGSEVAKADELVEIPEEAVLNCPLKGFRLAPVSRCVDCGCFGGLEDRFPGAPVGFQDRYLVKCFGAPVKRQPQLLSKD